MSVFGRLKNLCVSYFTQPSEDRPICRVVFDRKVCNLVVLGVGDGERAVHMIESAQRGVPQDRISFTGIDLFEARPAGSGGLSLKDAHCKFKTTRARVTLVPGDPYSALARVANSLVGTQMLVVSADQMGESLDRAWFYVPRLLAKDATIWIESSDAKTGELVLQPLSRVEVDALAAKSRPRRVAA